MTATNTIEALTARHHQLTESTSARLDVELLLAHVLQKSRTWLKTWPDYSLTEVEFCQFELLFKARLAGEPIAYLLGERGFWTLTLKSTPATLIPRPETELLVELALEKLKIDEAGSVLDLGTGTGAIALAIASERPKSKIVAVDAFADAVSLALENSANNGITNVEIFQSHWFENITGAFDVIVSNPPYIPDSDPHLNQGDVRFEPRRALASGVDGLDDLRHIIQQAPKYLHNRGWLLLEHGYDQRRAVGDLFTLAGFDNVATFNDLNDQPRVTLGQWIGTS